MDAFFFQAHFIKKGIKCKKVDGIHAFSVHDEGGKVC